MKFFKIIMLTLISTSATTSFALEDTKTKPTTTQSSITTSGKIKEPAEFQKIVDEYKQYVSKIPVEIRDEIIAYRKEIAKINKQKRLLYRKLSQAAQDYLKTEQEYKKKLPLNRKSLINVTN
ncbi:MAG: hypothetical protein AB8B68_04705 [Rickettsiaceae bacterium]